MRLLDVHKLTLKNFPSQNDRPQYAILSHTWDDVEVTLQDLTSPDVRSFLGFPKIKLSCEEAKMFGLDYIWIDTCCIDKTSSAELSEAINSMYRWYQSATVCFAYLSDFKANQHPDYLRFQLSRARWFSRGWTLQELIAPLVVIFYNRNWIEIGTKRTLSAVISHITAIPQEVLLGNISLNTISIANRMSWAARRKTTRTEDIAYSLMGIFDVNMPTLYGEGDKAFIRLQQEIMKSSDDQSLFAWSYESEDGPASFTDGPEFPNLAEEYRAVRLHETHDSTGLLSTSPQNFSQRRVIKAINVAETVRRPFTMTNHGLHIWLSLIKITSTLEPGHVIYKAVLDCEVSDRPGSNIILYLQEDKSTGQYFRIFPDRIHIVINHIQSAPKEIFVKMLYHRSVYPGTRFKNDFDGPFRLHLNQHALNREESPLHVVFCSEGIAGGPIGLSRYKSGHNFTDTLSLLVSPRADPSVRALIVMSVRQRHLVATVVVDQERLDQLDFPWATKNISRKRFHKMLTGLGDEFMNKNTENVITNSQGENVGVRDINNRWKISVSLRNGGTSSRPANDFKFQHVHVAAAFIQSPAFSQPDTLAYPKLHIEEAVSAGFPTVEVSVMYRQETEDAKINESAYTRLLRCSRYWHFLSSDRLGPVNHCDAIFFPLPYLHWEIKEEFFLYKWTPTAYQRRAVMALGSKDFKNGMMLELFLDEDFKVQHSLRIPDEKEWTSINRTFPSGCYSPEIGASVWSWMTANAHELSNQPPGQELNGFKTLLFNASNVYYGPTLRLNIDLDFPGNSGFSQSVSV